MDPRETQLRVLAAAILYRASLRTLRAPSTAEQKMALHARVEEAAWDLAPEMLRGVDGRDVDDGIPDAPEWRSLVARLATP
jgi:hypothetical protein